MLDIPTEPLGGRHFLEMTFDGSCVHKCPWCVYARNSTESAVTPDEKMLSLLTAIRSRFPYAMNVFLTTPILQMAGDFRLPRQIFHPAIEIWLSLDLDAEKYSSQAQDFIRRLPDVFRDFLPTDEIEIGVELGYRGNDYDFLIDAAHDMMTRLLALRQEKGITPKIVGLRVNHSNNHTGSEEVFRDIRTRFLEWKFHVDRIVDTSFKPKLPRLYTVREVFYNPPRNIGGIEEHKAFAASEVITVQKAKLTDTRMQCFIDFRFAYNGGWYGKSIAAETRVPYSTIYFSPDAAHLHHSAGNMRHWDALRRTHEEVAKVLADLPPDSSYPDFIDRIQKCKG